MDVDLRKLRYFVAGAEHLHFGRAAEALHIAQPVLSRQIKVLEDDLKAPLFVRDKRATELTPAGAQLLAEARPLLSQRSRAAASRHPCRPWPRHLRRGFHAWPHRSPHRSAHWSAVIQS